MPKNPKVAPAPPDGPEELFQVFGRQLHGSKLPLDLPSNKVIANDILRVMNAVRKPGDIFWIEKVTGAVGGEEGVVTKNDGNEYPGLHAMMSEMDIHPMSDLNIKRPTRVCAATQYRRSHHHPRRSICQAILDWFDNLLCHHQGPGERWTVRAVLVLWAIVTLILIGETILGR